MELRKHIFKNKTVTDIFLQFQVYMLSIPVNTMAVVYISYQNTLVM